MPYAFLSQEWVDAARAIRTEYEDQAPTLAVPVRMNQIVTASPFSDGVIKAHLDTSDGLVDIELGHLDDPDLTVTLEYETARSIFVEGDMQVAMGAFLSGRIKVDGDITKLLELQTAPPAGGAEAGVAGEIYRRIRDITAS